MQTKLRVTIVVTKVMVKSVTLTAMSVMAKVKKAVMMVVLTRGRR